MSGPTTTNILPPAVQQQLSMKLLARPMPDLIHTTLGYPITMDQQSGDILRRRRYNNLMTAPVSLGNGIVDPGAQQLTTLDIDARIDWYGTYMILQEQVMLINEDPVLNSAISTLGQSLRETEDQLARSMMEGSFPPINCTSGFNGDNPTNIAPLDSSKAIRLLRTANAQYIMDIIEGENKLGTAPVRTAFFGLAHTNLSADLDQMVGFQNVASYANQANLLMSEWGVIRNLRFLLSSVGSISSMASALGQDVYNIFIPGQESYDMVDLDGYSAQFIYAPPEIASPRLRLYQTAGWKMAQVFNTTNTSWALNLRCTLAVAL
jgi:N4-gp56 family major capsid protein